MYSLYITRCKISQIQNVKNFNGIWASLFIRRKKKEEVKGKKRGIGEQTVEEEEEEEGEVKKKELSWNAN